MAVISIRINAREEKIINYLVEHFDEDRSTLIKHSIFELYEDLKDKEIIEEFENKEKGNKKVRFVSSEEARKSLKG